MEKKMDIIRSLLKIIMWFLIAGFGCNFIMQTISYSFYKNAKKMTDISCTPQFIKFKETLTGYGNNLDSKNNNKVILFFGGSNYIAYNSIGKYSTKFDYPFISVDYYGTQDSSGKINLKTMKKSAEGLYEWTRNHYPDSEIIIIGHSYGAGIATYLASVRECHSLLIVAGYRDVSDLYNKIIPVFWGPLKVFISNNIRTAEYAENVECPVYIIGSTGDKVLSFSLQEKLSCSFKNPKIKIFDDIAHEDYFCSDNVIDFINQIIGQDNDKELKLL
ncbi:alpha/beta fold hydrolase [Acetivibrio straminisolvens]|uniref:alpha/beta fold hydrolase n=1 Tax=Acetivibrio straminisolvens TaxID=253314 RepID=UPI00223FE70D|nr:alpha/beta fold hydrolase [Acetivibrio straminisolvens]